jgi:hypothetical protein
MRFLGAPRWLRIQLVLSSPFCWPGTDDSGLTDESKRLIAEKATEPLDIKVFVTPTCPHWPKSRHAGTPHGGRKPKYFSDVCRGQRVPRSGRGNIGLLEFPKTVSSAGAEILGALPEDQFVVGVLDRQLDSGLLP